MVSMTRSNRCRLAIIGDFCEKIVQMLLTYVNMMLPHDITDGDLIRGDAEDALIRSVPFSAYTATVIEIAVRLTNPFPSGMSSFTFVLHLVRRKTMILDFEGKRPRLIQLPLLRKTP